MEYVAAKSSMCRQCGRYFPPFAPKAGLKLHIKEEAPAPDNSSIRHKLEDFWNLHCDDMATINFSGRIPGRLTARHIVVERKANIHCFRRVRVSSIEIKGAMSGEIVAQTIVTIHKKGSLEGNVTAKAITVEKG